MRGLPNLPLLHQGQTLYSWCSAAHFTNAGMSVVDTNRALFGSPYAGLIHDFPSHLDQLVASCGDALPDPRTLALQHTLLGYFLSIQVTSAAATFLDRVRTGALPSIKMRLGITASRVCGSHPLKSCDDCIKSDEKDAGGIALWHLAHQWPSSMVCTAHCRPLVMTMDLVSPVHRRRWLLPGETRHIQRVAVPILGDTQLRRLLQLADYSKQLASSDAGSFDAMRMAHTYRTRLKTMGLATANGNLRLKRLLDMARSQYRGIETVPGFEALQSIGPDWPGLSGSFSRRALSPGHPLKHLLLISMLFESWPEFVIAYDTPKDEAVSTNPSDIVPEEDRLEEDIYKLVVFESCSISKASLRLGISTTTGVQIAKRLGIKYVERPKVLHGAALKQVRRLLLRGVPVNEIASATNISVVTINRLLAGDEELKAARTFRIYLSTRALARKRFVLLAKQHPNSNVQALRSISGNTYMWLFRHDRLWLREHIPSLWNSV